MAGGVYVSNYLPCKVSTLFPNVKIGYSYLITEDIMLKRVSEISTVPGFIVRDQLRVIHPTQNVEDQEVIMSKICLFHNMTPGFLKLWDVGVNDLKFLIPRFDDIQERLHIPLNWNAIDLAYQVYFNEIIRVSGLCDYLLQPLKSEVVYLSNT